MLLPESAGRGAVIEAAEKCFDLQNPLLQSYDEDFNEWVDLPDTYTPTHKDKIQVLTRTVIEMPAMSEEVENQVSKGFCVF